MTPSELENRLIDFAVNIIHLCDALPNKLGGKTLANQLVRSGTSPALNYGETLGAESEKDFIHKAGIVLKELRESYNALRIIHKAQLYIDNKKLDSLLKESNELVSIFVATIKTAKKMK